MGGRAHTRSSHCFENLSAGRKDAHGVARALGTHVVGSLARTQRATDTHTASALCRREACPCAATCDVITVCACVCGVRAHPSGKRAPPCRPRHSPTVPARHGATTASSGRVVVAQPDCRVACSRRAVGATVQCLHVHAADARSTDLPHMLNADGSGASSRNGHISGACWNETANGTADLHGRGVDEQSLNRGCKLEQGRVVC